MVEVKKSQVLEVLQKRQTNLAQPMSNMDNSDRGSIGVAMMDSGNKNFQSATSPSQKFYAQNHAVSNHGQLNGRQDNDLLLLTQQLASAYLQNNKVEPSEVQKVINDIYHSLLNINHHHQSQQTNQAAAVPIDESIQPDYIICLEDGKKLKMLKRHLRTNFNLTPEEYRAKWGLPPNYPMVAPNYANLRSDYAKQLGLGKTLDKTAKHRNAVVEKNLSGKI